MLTQIINSATKSYEIIFCNDASPDNSQELLDKIAENDKNVRLLRNPENMGLVYSMKRLIEESRGKIIAYADIGTGFFLIKKRCFNDFDFVTRGFAVSIELPAKLNKKGYRFAEIPVEYNHHSGPASTFKLFKHFLPTFYETLLVWYDIRIKKN